MDEIAEALIVAFLLMLPATALAGLLWMMRHKIFPNRKSRRAPGQSVRDRKPRDRKAEPHARPAGD